MGAIRVKPWNHPIVELQKPPQVTQVHDSGCVSIADSIGTPLQVFSRALPESAGSFQNSTEVLPVAAYNARTSSGAVTKKMLFGLMSQENSAGSRYQDSFSLAQLINHASLNDPPNSTQVNSFGISTHTGEKTGSFAKGQQSAD